MSLPEGCGRTNCGAGTWAEEGAAAARPGADADSADGGRELGGDCGQAGLDAPDDLDCGDRVLLLAAGRGGDLLRPTVADRGRSLPVGQVCTGTAGGIFERVELCAVRGFDGFTAWNFDCD